ncbi:MAG: cytochrome c oxidase subunit 4 [Candidatus Promineifilaceae bacterium]
MEDHPEIHLPSPSYWPIVLAFGMALIAVGVVSTIFISLVGVVVLLVAIAGWTWENRVAEQEEPHE